MGSVVVVPLLCCCRSSLNLDYFNKLTKAALLLAAAAAAVLVGVHHHNTRTKLCIEGTPHLKNLPLQKDMDDRSHIGAERDREHADERLYTDINDNSANFRLDSPPLKPDHCDLLLDAIDAQLVELQVHSQKSQEGVIDHDCTSTESSTSHQETPAIREDLKQKLSARGTGNKEEMESHREQVMWRLERLLGDACKDGTAAGGTHRLSDSICTEDFVKRFREEMVELPLVEGSEQPDRVKGAERTEISDSDTFQGEQKGQRLPYVGRRGTATTGTEKGLCDSSEAEMSHFREKAGAGERYTPPQKHSDNDNILHSSEGVTEKLQIYTSSPKARCLAGVPMLSFDTVSIDSDLDSISTEQVRQHIHRQPEMWMNFVTTKLMMKQPHRKKVNLNLHQKCQKEEETLCLHRSQLNEVQLSLSELQQKKQHALQELEQLTAETAQMEKEKKSLESVLRERRAEKDSICCELQKLQRQKEPGFYEARSKDVELKNQQQPNVAMSVLEREEIERQLDNAKSELFAEQRRAREKMESMQEKLEESCEELQRAKESESSLRNRCICLEEAQKYTKQQFEDLEYQVIELQDELRESKTRVGSLEKMLAQKELQLMENQEQHSSLQGNRDELKGELQRIKAQHYNALKEAQEQATKVTEAALKQQKKDLALAHEMQIQKINKQAEEEKAKALKEQALSLTKHIGSLQNSIQLKEEEASNLRMCLEKKKEEAMKREEEMCREVSDKVHKAVEAEKRKREAEKVEAVQVHCGILEEQNRKSLENMRSKIQQEKSKGLALQCKVVDLQTRVQELEAESCAQQKEQESLLAVICKTLKEEHQAELQRTQRQMAQESQRTVRRLEKAVQIAEKECNRLRATLEEKERSQSEATAEVDRQRRLWIQELETECKHLYYLVDQGGDKSSTGQLFSSSTVAEALTALRTIREQLKHFICRLHRELNSQKQTTEQLSKDKERELSIQRQQLRMERDQALDSLKERLIQEHIEELSSLKWAHICDGGSEQVAASLRKQLKAKDLELRQVQRSMSEWKEQTAARLACKFEEELTAELERKTLKTQDEKLKRPEGMTHSAKEAQISVRVPSPHAVDSAASNSPSDTASLKLLRYLQSRVKQLRVENQTFHWSPTPSSTDLSGSYLNTAPDSAGIHCISSG
ncbi:plectin [Sphaeramia orbicularis]|uniref:plectin n=1 Tax=Sphaeramia orbicularis TaxID=375764 RepID=UPI001181067D|nr:plectin-like [Sphaeramia orbicularis]